MLLHYLNSLHIFFKKKKGNEMNTKGGQQEEVLQKIACLEKHKTKNYDVQRVIYIIAKCI